MVVTDRADFKSKVVSSMRSFTKESSENMLVFSETPPFDMPSEYDPTSGLINNYPRAIRTELNEGAKHRTNQYLNNRIGQDHRGIKGRYRPMRAFKSPESASRFCRGFDELRNHRHLV